MASGKRFCDLQKFSRAVERAVSVPGEDNCREVERQLEILLSHSEVFPFYTSEITETDTDSICTLIRVLGNPCTPISISAFIMKALRMQAKSDAIRDVMIAQFNMFHSLSIILMKDQDGEECLKLLQQLTYGIRTTCPNGCIEDIIRFVVNKIVSQLQGSMLECLDVLANLCQGSVTVQAFVKGLPSIHTLQRKLLSNLSNTNVSVVILSLHILASLFLTEELGTRIFSSSNMEQSFQLAFSVLFAYGTNMAGATYAVDLLVDILSYERMQIVFKQFGQLQDCLQKMVSLLPRAEGIMRTKMIELCVVLCRVSGLRGTMAKLLLYRRTTLVAGANICTFPLSTLLTNWTIPSAICPNSTLVMLDLLKEILQEALNGAETWDCMEQIESTLVQITSACHPPDYTKGDDVIHACLVQVSKLLSIWSDMMSSESVTKQILEYTKTDYLLSLIQDHVRNSHTYSKEKSWLPVGMEVVMLSVHLLLKHAQYSRNAKADLHCILKEQQLLPIIGHSLQSTNKMMIMIVLHLLVEAQNAEGFDVGRLAEVLIVINNKRKIEAVQQSAVLADMECSTKVLMPEKVVVDTSAVDELIQKFKNGLELKDLKTSEIIDVYEHKLQAMHLKESHLQDLVDAKSLALTQADRLISQYRGKKAHFDDECSKLRTLLQDAEKRSEKLSEKVDELQKHLIQQTKEMDNLKSHNVALLHIAEEHKKVLAAFREQSAKLEGTQQNLLSRDEQIRQLCSQLAQLQSNYEAATVQKQRLNEQFKKMGGELQQLQERCHYSEDKCQSLQNTLLEQQEKNKSLENVKEVLEGNIGSLNTKLRLSEQQIQALNEECTAQKGEVNVLKEHITRLQGEVQEIKTENVKLQEEVNLFSAVKSLILKKS